MQFQEHTFSQNLALSNTLIVRLRFYPDVTHRQVFVTYRNCLIYRILKITVFTYDEIEWENLVQKDIMRTRNRLMKPSRDVLDRLFYHDIIYEIDKRFVL